MQHDSVDRFICTHSSLFCFAHRLQKARLKAVESLKQEHRSIVVATDVAARGLDIPSVATVVHYDVARQVDTFIHRAGRTAVSLLVLTSASLYDATMTIQLGFGLESPTIRGSSLI